VYSLLEEVMSSRIQKVCIYCASSRQANPEYADAARRLGRFLAESDITIVYGGGAVGSMGALADGALSANGRVIGVIPRFMVDLEWGHTGLSELRVVDHLHERKRLLIEGTDALIGLPGGSGTLEEMLEALTWKRLGLYLKPIVLLNTRGYFAPLFAQLEAAISERFMDPRHRAMWQVAERVEDILPAIEAAPSWSSEARGFAAL